MNRVRLHTGLTVAIFLFFGWIFSPEMIAAPGMRKPEPGIRAPRGMPIRVGGNISEDPRMHIVYPVYPEKAKREHIEGKVLLRLLINEEGLVYHLSGEPENNKLLEKAAIDAVRQWRYRPTLLNGEPVPVITKVTVSFVWKDREDIRVWLDESGPSCQIKQILKARGAVWIEIHGAPYRVREDLRRKLVPLGERVHWPIHYHVYGGQLFYSMGMTASGMGEIPRFSKTDTERIRQLAEASGKFGKEASSRLIYKLYFDKDHRFVELRRLEGPEIPEVESELEHIRPRFFELADTPVDIFFELNLSPPSTPAVGNPQR
jgi:TonB family protein